MQLTDANTAQILQCLFLTPKKSNFLVCTLKRTAATLLLSLYTVKNNKCSKHTTVFNTQSHAQLGVTCTQYLCTLFEVWGAHLQLCACTISGVWLCYLKELYRSVIIMNLLEINMFDTASVAVYNIILRHTCIIIKDRNFGSWQYLSKGNFFSVGVLIC